MATPPTPVVPGHSLGSIALGASLHEVLSIVKDDKEQYPAIDIHYSQTEPIVTPVVVSLPENGIRLRFDGADQRLRLIEVMDFRKIKLAYKGSDVVKTQDDSPATTGPTFKRIYHLFGPSYPGEYLAPKNRSPTGTYVVSYPGVAFTLPLQHSAWSKDKDHVSLLGSNVASPATHMALFEGKSWPEARRDLFIRVPTGPRLSALASRTKDSLPAELEVAQVLGDGRIELLRNNGAPPFTIVLNQTTSQDLNTELGPPDATHKRDERSETPEPGVHRRTGSTSRPMSNGRAHPGSQPSSYSSTGTDTFDVDFDSGDAEEDPAERASREKFWCYFSHGLDILVGPPTDNDQSTDRDDSRDRTPLSASPHLVVTKVIIHGNVPGSYAFNRHRRLRWTIDFPPHEPMACLTSEQHFEHEIKPALLDTFANTWPESEMGKGKVVNRTWGGSGPSDSSFFLPDAEEDIVDGGGSEQWLGNTKLFAFPGLVFEVLENGSVGALTVY